MIYDCRGRSVLRLFQPQYPFFRTLYRNAESDHTSQRIAKEDKAVDKKLTGI